MSVRTVSNVTNRPDKVTSATVARVQSAIDLLGFVRNDAARQLRAGRSLGLVVLDVANPFFTDIARGTEDRAAEDGLAVLLGNTDDTWPARPPASTCSKSSACTVCCFHRSATSATDSRDCARVARPPFWLTARPTTTASFRSPSTTWPGGRLASAHLQSIGRTRLAFVGGPSSIRQVVDRLQGARLAVAEHPSAVLEVIDTDALSVSAGRAAGQQVLERVPGDRPDAIFAANDLLAIGVLQALNVRGDPHVPRDIALIGYDDIAFAAVTVVPLSSTRQPSVLIGYTAAADLLLREADGGDDFEHEQIVFQPELVIRESTQA